jgi:sugar lactone lactonase YvrE
MNTLRFCAIAALTATVLVACRSTGTAFNPPGGISTLDHAIVVADVVNNAIDMYPLTANGSSAAPSAQITGTSTNLDQPEGVFVDKAHNALWVGNYTSGSNGTVTEYALSANGNATPLKTIGGATTTIEGPGGIYVDSSGTLYVADYEASTIDVFAASANGDVAPTRQITGVPEASGLWLDSSGDIWVGEAEDGTILEFANSANGAATPLATITSSALSAVMGVFIDSHQNVWAADCTALGSTPNVVEFAHGTTGTGLTPTVDIAGTNTGFDCPNGVVLDSSGNIYVGDYGSAAVDVFTSGANGNVAPVQTIPAGVTTTLAKPIGVVVY